MRFDSKKVLAAAAVAALAWPMTASAQQIGISIGIRETGTAAAVGADGGTANGIEWINRDGQFLTLNDTWQTFTWDFFSDPILAFAGATANGTLENGRGVLEHIRFLNGIGSADQFEIFVDEIINTVSGVPIKITGFEADEPVPAIVGSANGTFMFRQPNFSGSTNTNVTGTPNAALVTDTEADVGTQSLRFAWAFVDGDPTRWVRMTTFNTLNRPNPTVDYSTAGNTLSMRVKGRIIEPDVRWVTAGPGPVNWSDPGNWNNGIVPGISFIFTETAYFGAAATAPTTVVVDTPISINTLRLQNSNSYTFETADPFNNHITISGSASSNANINAQQGSHTINVPILLQTRPFAVNVGEANAVLTLSSVDFNSLGLFPDQGVSMIKNGPGTVVLPAVRSFVNDPDDSPPTPPNPSRSLTVNAGTVKLTPSASASSPTVSRSNRIIMTGTTDAWTGRLDMTNNAWIIDVADPALGGTDQRSLQENRIKQGYNGGSWNGTGGIISSTAAVTPGHAVGIATTADLGNPSTYLGEPVDAHTVVMRYTRVGDANLDGITNIGDFSILGANFNLPGRWATGDFNYDGQVNIGDFSLLAANFNQSIAADGARSPVPEPAALSLLGLAGLLGLRRRR